MTVEEYLEEYESQYHDLEDIEEQIASIESSLGIKGMDYSADKVLSSSGISFDDMVIRKMDLEEKKQTLTASLLLRHMKMAVMFSDLSDTDRRIAELTWFDFEGTVSISQQVGISRQQVWRRRRAIVSLLENVT